MNILCAFSIDPFIGKVEKHSLSQQTLMELLIGNISNKAVLCGSEDIPTDITEWTLVEMNDAKEVVQFSWSYRALKGSIDLQWLPPSIQNAFLATNYLTGSVDLTCLPDGLQTLNVGGNQLHGTVDLTQLPSCMKRLYLHGNDFTGKTDFNQLLKSLGVLNVQDTQLEGEIFAFDGALRTRDSNVKDMRKK